MCCDIEITFQSAKQFAKDFKRFAKDHARRFAKDFEKRLAKVMQNALQNVSANRVWAGTMSLPRQTS